MTIKNCLLAATFALSTTTLLPDPATPSVYTVDTIVETTTAAEPKKEQLSSPRDWKGLCKLYASSILAGGAIGFTTGYIEQCVEKQFETSAVTTLVLWWIELAARTEIINVLHKDFTAYGIKSKKIIMEFAGRFASWTPYLFLKK